MSKPITYRSPVDWVAYAPSGAVNKGVKSHVFSTKSEAVKFAKSQEPHKPIDIYNVGLPDEYWSVDWVPKDQPCREICRDSTRLVDHRQQLTKGAS